MLTDEQKERITFLLGYPSKILRDNSTHFNRIFNNRLTNLSDIAVNQIGELLDLVTVARKKLDESQDEAKVASVDGLSFDTSRAVTNIKSQYYRYLKEIGSLLDIPVRRMMMTVGVRQ